MSQALLQILTRLTDPSRNLDEGHHLLFQVTVTEQTVHRLHEHVDTLVTELIAARRRYDQRVVVEFLTQQGTGHLQHLPPGGITLTGELRGSRHEAVVEAIRQHHVRALVQQFLTLLRRDVAHRREAVHIVSRLLLYRVFALHVQLLGHLVTIISKQIVVERFHVTSYRTPDACGMRREHRTDLRQPVVDIERTQSAHPLIGMVYHLLVAVQIMMIETLHHQSSSIREHRSLVVVAIGMQTVHAVVFPQPAIYLILFLEKRLEVHQDGDRCARHRPSAHPGTQSWQSEFTVTFLGFALPVGKERFVLFEIRTLFLFPAIRTYENDLILKCLLQGLGACRKNGIDSPYFIADFPT